MRRLAPAAAVLTLVTWPVPGLLPQASLDDSWRVALQLAAVHGLPFGRDIVFTYGPLGFLSTPLLVAVWSAAVALAYAAVAQLALAAVVLAAAARVFGWAVGAALAFVVVGLLGQRYFLSDAAVFLVFFAVVWLLEREAPLLAWWMLPLGGALAAFELLVKLNSGIVCLVLLALAAWRVPPRGMRAELGLLASFAVAAVVLWLASGNPISELPGWLRESAHIVSGYTSAMALEAPGRSGAYVWAAVLVAGGAAALAIHVRELPRSRAAALVLATLAYTYAYFKEGFVRHDAHDLLFFGAIGVGLLAFRWRGATRWVAAVLVAVAAGATLAMSDDGIAQWNPYGHARAAVLEIRELARPGAVEQARANLRAQFGVPAAEVRLLRGYSVDVAPYASAAAWAYGLRWKPEPLLQWYMAYDAGLDGFNADALVRRGAARILWQQLASLDGVPAQFEAPTTYLALVCHYRELAVSSDWEVLARSANRCGSPRVLSTVQVRAGDAVRVPHGEPGEIVYARLHVRWPLVSSLGALVFKPLHLPHLDLGSNGFRLLPATADGPLVLRMPATGGFSPGFGGAESYDSFRLLRVPSSYSVEFDAVSLAPPR